MDVLVRSARATKDARIIGEEGANDEEQDGMHHVSEHEHATNVRVRLPRAVGRGGLTREESVSAWLKRVKGEEDFMLQWNREFE